MNQTEAIALLLDTLDVLEFVARHMHPPQLGRLAAMLGDRDASLRLAVWPEPWREPLERAAAATLRACEGLREAVDSPDGLRLAYRALRQVPRAHEALYELAVLLTTVDRFFRAPTAGTAGGEVQ